MWTCFFFSKKKDCREFFFLKKKHTEFAMTTCEVDTETQFDTLSLVNLESCYRSGEIQQSMFTQRVVATMSKILQLITIQGMRPRVIVRYDSVTHEPLAIYTSIHALKSAWPTIESTTFDFCAMWYKHCNKTSSLSMTQFHALCAAKPELLQHLQLHDVKCLASPTIERIRRRNALYKLCYT